MDEGHLECDDDQANFGAVRRNNAESGREETPAHIETSVSRHGAVNSSFEMSLLVILCQSTRGKCIEP
jgi:hypothetical protein